MIDEEFWEHHDINTFHDSLDEVMEHLDIKGQKRSLIDFLTFCVSVLEGDEE